MLRRVRESIIETELVAGEKNIPLRRMYNAAVLRAGGAGEEKSSGTENAGLFDVLATLRRERVPPPPLEPNLFFIHPDVEEFVRANPLLSAEVEKVVPQHRVVYDTVSDDLIILRRVDHEKMNTFRSYVHTFLTVVEGDFKTPPPVWELQERQELEGQVKKVKLHADKLYVYHGVGYVAPEVENLVIKDSENRSYTFYMETE